MRHFALGLVGMLMLVAPTIAQNNCSDGIRHDDNTFETGAGWSFVASRGEYVMRVDPPAPGKLEAVCMCWSRDDTDSTIFFNLKIYAADGAGGKPGTLLGSLPTLQASGVGTNPTWFRYDVSSLNIITSGSVYIGSEWDPGDDEDFFLCMDSNGPTKQPAYGSSSILGGPPSSELGVVGFFPQYRTLGVRAKLGEVPGGCIPSASTLCLNQGRFAVTAKFKTSTAEEDDANVFKLTDETGYLWFFSSSNVEAVVKVLDACALNGKYWVFAGGLTDVQVDLTVRDSVTGNVKTYRNPQGSPFQAIQDTAALPCN